MVILHPKTKEKKAEQEEEEGRYSSGLQ